MKINGNEKIIRYQNKRNFFFFFISISKFKKYQFHFGVMLPMMCKILLRLCLGHKNARLRTIVSGTSWCCWLRISGSGPSMFILVMAAKRRPSISQVMFQSQINCRCVLLCFNWQDIFRVMSPKWSWIYVDIKRVIGLIIDCTNSGIFFKEACA